jgi:polar amino acid transport system permease protein
MNEFVHALGVLATGIGNTFLLTGASFVLGAVIAVPVVLCRVSPVTPLRVIATSYTELSRGIPPIVWLFILYFGLTQFGLRLESMTAAVVGLGIISGGYLAEIYRSGLRAVPDGQTEAAHALGIPRVAIYTKVIVPQAVVTVLPLAATYAVGLLKDSAVASVIGAQEITALAVSLSKREVEGLTIFAAAGLVYLVISVPMSALARAAGSYLTARLEAA